MKYLYPLLSKYDLYVARIGGSGLGNILFPYCRALVDSKKYNIPLIWPTWRSIKIGPYLRGEYDKRKYDDLFENNNGSVDGREKILLLNKYPKILRENVNIKEADDCIIIYTGMKGSFHPFLNEYEYIKADLIKNLKKGNRKWMEYDFNDSINVHIRLGDFAMMTQKNITSDQYSNVRIPIKWYVDIIKQIMEALDHKIKINLFSDGTDEELEPLLVLPNVERITFGTSISDMLALGGG